jgi:hypothetical protein
VQNVQSSYWTPFDIGGGVGRHGRGLASSPHPAQLDREGRAPKDIHYGGDEFITRSTMVFRKEQGEWRVVHAHFSEASAGPRPGGV